MNTLEDVLQMPLYDMQGTKAVAAGAIDATFKINGVAVGPVAAVLADDSNGALRAAINAKTSQTGVVASLGASNQLVLTSTAGGAIQLTSGTGADAQTDSNVLGFNKYMQMSKSAETLFQTYTAQRLNIENEKKEYLELVEQKKKLQEQQASLEAQLQDALQYSVANKELYDNLKIGLNQETTIKNKIEQTKSQIENIYKKATIS